MIRRLRRGTVKARMALNHAAKARVEALWKWERRWRRIKAFDVGFRLQRLRLRMHDSNYRL